MLQECTLSMVDEVTSHRCYSNLVIKSVGAHILDIRCTLFAYASRKRMSGQGKGGQQLVFD